MKKFRIVSTAPDGATITESHLDTMEAATRRLKMLTRRDPNVEYWIQPPAVTVTPISATDPTAAHIVRNAA